MSESNSMKEDDKNTTPKCEFVKAWIGKCGKPLGPGMIMCDEHSTKKCCSCGAPATHECPETMGLVCGCDLCDECEHTICTNGCNSGAPLPEGLKGHCKKSEQKIKPWWMKEKDIDIKTTPRTDAPNFPLTENEKDYTVVYAEFFQRGSHMNQIVRHKVITCTKSSLKETVEKEIGWNNVHFVFDGRCEETKD